MNKVVRFFYEVKAELQKTTWPKREELVGSTIIVCIFVVILALILGAMDIGFAFVVRKILGQGALVV